MSKQFLYLTILLFLFLSCEKEQTELPWTTINSPIDTRLQSVFFTNDGIGHIVGGDVWSYGVHLVSYDEGISWQTDTFSTKMLYDIGYSVDGSKFFAAGIGGLFQKNGITENWFGRGLGILQSVPPFNDLGFRDNGELLIAGGIAFGNGVILQIDSSSSGVLSRHDFDNEISAICYSDEMTAHAVGYGIVLISHDGGATWIRQEVNSDFYRSIHFPETQIGYAVGSSGSIIKTIDQGTTWEKIRDGDQFSVSNQPFRAVYFVNAEKGYIVGEGGLFWQTLDGGDHWKQVKDFPDVDLYDVFVRENKGYIVGTKGKIFEFSN